MRTTREKFISMMQSKYPFWIMLSTCILLGIYGGLNTESLHDTTSMTIALTGGFIVVIGYRIAIFIADRINQSDK